MLPSLVLNRCPLVDPRECRNPRDFFPRHLMATRPDIASAVNGIKGEVSEVDCVPIALIGLPLIVQALDNPESLDGMCKGNPRAECGLQFVALNPQPDRAV